MVTNNSGIMYLYLTSFLVGMAILIIEILGFRVFAPYFGTSVFVTGSMIGVIIGSLSIGYYFGGSMADKYPNDKYVYFVIFASGLYLSAMFVLYKSILNYFTGFGLIVGTSLSTLVIFIPPMVLLSMVTPYVVKLVSRPESIGKDAGRVFAVSTVGSVLGSFLTTFYLLPEYGSNDSMLMGIVLIFTISIVGLLQHSLSYSLLSAGVSIVFIPQFEPIPDAQAGELIYQEESLYSLVQIHEKDGARTMSFNNYKGQQSSTAPPKLIGSSSYPNSYIQFFNLAPYLNPVSNVSSEDPFTVLILGMSAGASVHELDYFFGKNIDIDAVEIDPTVVKLGKKYFDTKETDNIHIHVEDARTYVSKPGKKYDFVEIDLFQGGPEVPFYTATVEFFQQVSERLSDSGLVMMNILGNTENNDFLLIPVANTMAEVFPSIYFVRVGGNTIVVAFQEEIDRSKIISRLRHVDNKQLAIYTIHTAKNIVRYVPKGDSADRLVFTDDKAPVELLNRQVFQNIMAAIEHK